VWVLRFVIIYLFIFFEKKLIFFLQIFSRGCSVQRHKTNNGVFFFKEILFFFYFGFDFALCLSIIVDTKDDSDNDHNGDREDE